eukprot:10579424-Alexandrium_andersonii.AAC.1
MLANAAIRLNPQSAVPKTQNRFRRSNLELRGPSGLNMGPCNSRGVRSAPFLAQNPNPPTKAGLEGV